MAVLLSQWETIKKDKHVNHCHDQRKQFLMFVLSVDIIIGREALVVLLQLSKFMSEKREEPLSQVRGWVNSQIEISVARSYSQIIHGARHPS